MMGFHRRKGWPFIERSGLREARLGFKEAKERRPAVDALSSEMIEAGERNHLAERLAKSLEGRYNK